jgi:hypothetical protein
MKGESVSEVTVRFLRNANDRNTLESFSAGQELSLPADQAYRLINHEENVAEEVSSEEQAPASGSSAPAPSPKKGKKGSDSNPVPMGEASS